MKNLDIKALMKEAERMQKEIAQKQSQLEKILVHGSSGGGAVQVTATATMRLIDMKILPEAVDPNDLSLLQDMILAAVNQALTEAERKAAEVMNEATGGMFSLPTPKK